MLYNKISRNNIIFSLSIILLVLSVSFAFAQDSQQEEPPSGCTSDCEAITEDSDSKCIDWCAFNGGGGKMSSETLPKITFSDKSPEEVKSFLKDLNNDPQKSEILANKNIEFLESYGKTFGSNLRFGKKSGFDVKDVQFANNGQVTYKGRNYDLSNPNQFPSGSTASITSTGIDLVPPSNSKVDVSNLRSGDNLFMDKGSLDLGKSGIASVFGVNGAIKFGENGEVIIPSKATYIDSKGLSFTNIGSTELSIIYGDQFVLGKDAVVFRTDGTVSLFSTSFGVYGVNGINPSKEFKLTLDGNYDLINAGGASKLITQSNFGVGEYKYEKGVTTTITDGKEYYRSPDEGVKDIQRVLGIENDDGLYGPRTKDAVKGFQELNNLEPTGNFGDKERAIFQNKFTKYSKIIDSENSLGLFKSSDGRYMASDGKGIVDIGEKPTIVVPKTDKGTTLNPPPSIAAEALSLEEINEITNQDRENIKSIVPEENQPKEISSTGDAVKVDKKLPLTENPLVADSRSKLNVGESVESYLKSREGKENTLPGATDTYEKNKKILNNENKEKIKFGDTVLANYMRTKEDKIPYSFPAIGKGKEYARGCSSLSDCTVETNNAIKEYINNELSAKYPGFKLLTKDYDSVFGRGTRAESEKLFESLGEMGAGQTYNANRLVNTDGTPTQFFLDNCPYGNCIITKGTGGHVGYLVHDGNSNQIRILDSSSVYSGGAVGERDFRSLKWSSATAFVIDNPESIVKKAEETLLNQGKIK